MPNTSGSTAYVYTTNGSSLVETVVGQIEISPGLSGVPASFNDAAAITFGNAIQAAWVNAGFTDVTVQVMKEVRSETDYTSNGSTFV